MHQQNNFYSQDNNLANVDGSIMPEGEMRQQQSQQTILQKLPASQNLDNIIMVDESARNEELDGFEPSLEHEITKNAVEEGLGQQNLDLTADELRGGPRMTKSLAADEPMEANEDEDEKK